MTLWNLWISKTWGTFWTLSNHFMILLFDPVSCFSINFSLTFSLDKQWNIIKQLDNSLSASETWVSKRSKEQRRRAQNPLWMKNLRYFSGQNSPLVMVNLAIRFVSQVCWYKPIKNVNLISLVTVFLFNLGLCSFLACGCYCPRQPRTACLGYYFVGQCFCWMGSSALFGSGQSTVVSSGQYSQHEI